ncbi:DUF1804 family protein [Hydrocarboniphaga effusa]|uniref:DUF1804 family protein n=1 Tax=Hydrocarboniphaga effusa TaxID=243629 RepID=UPI003BA86AD0
MAHDSAKRQEVRRRYVTDQQPLKAAAQLSGISYSTARGWKDAALRIGDDWDHARMADAVGDGGVRELTREVLTEFVPLFRSTIEAIRTSDKLKAVDKVEAMARLADAYQKVVKASGAVDPAVAKLGWAMDVMRLLAQFCAEKFPQHQSALMELLEPFGERLSVEYG